ncbi:histidine--tRNA ligase [Deltaproteobacteria bacterium TL4]
MIDLQPVKGTRDFFPEQMRLRNWLFQIWRETAEQYGFEEYDACVLEHEELYIRKAGDEIGDQLYNFEDKSGRRLSLRPEMTPSLARMIMQNQQTLSFPVKWFSIPQCFRYERMTRGRKREHFQWNVDIMGQESNIAEAEALSILLSACQKMQLSSKDIRVFINDRRILNAILDQLNVPAQLHVPVMIVMDKRDKIPIETFNELLQKAQMTPAQIEQLHPFIQMTSLEDLGAVLTENPGIENIKNIQKILQESGFGDYVQFDISIVRGLSYYTSTVFEVNTPQKSFRALCGGGRYDSLLSTYGGEAIPCFGFGFGDVVILEVLQELDRLPKLSKKLDYMLVPYSEAEMGFALKVGNQLRTQGLMVECNFSQKKVKKILQQAHELGVAKVVLLFPDELKTGHVAVRDMHSHQQTIIPLSELLSLPGA